MIEDISFKNYKKKVDIHGTVLYPAVMIAPVQKLYIKKYITSDIKKVLDPFMGSGTSIYEIAKLRGCDIELYGCDINPLAYLITNTKLKGIDESVFYRDIYNLKRNLEIFNEIDFTFSKIEKWFREDVAKELKVIKKAISCVQNDKNRSFFWCMFSETIRKYSNSRSSTYKLHIKKDNEIDKMDTNVKKYFLNLCYENNKFYNMSYMKTNLFKKDCLKLMKSMHDDYIDIVITSPPYGDNKTTVPYGQFSSLALNWIDKNDLNLEGWELDNYSILDNRSLGGKNRDIGHCKEKIIFINETLDKINVSKRQKVINFFMDYFNVLDEIARITKKNIIITLGNRRVDNIEINLTEITVEYLKNKNFILVEENERIIPNKRIPRKTSNVNGIGVPSMNKEYVIVFEKSVV